MVINNADAAKNMEIEIPGVDANRGLDLCDGDLSIYLRILHSYAVNTPIVLDKIRNVSEETLKDYAIKLHGIKGTSEAIGAEEARKTAKHLEEMAKCNDLAGVVAKNNDLIKYVENLVNRIQVFLQKYEAAGGESFR